MSYDAGSAHADQDPHRNPTTSPSGPARWVGRPKKGNRSAPSWVIASGTGRATTRGSGEVIELECGITVYPAREEHGRWRAVWYENGDRRQCEAASEAKLAARLEKVAERLEADAPNMSRPGADLIAHYLDPGRLSAGRQWSRKHAHTQRRLYERFAAPVIDAVTCQDITVGHMQQTVNAAPTPGEGNRVQGMISALVSAGLEGGYRANPWLARVHWQAGDRPLPRPGSASLATQRCGSTLPRFSPTRTSPSSAERCTGRHGERDELMAVTAAYSGLRWGELTALTTGQIDQVGSGHHGGPQGGRDRRAPVRRGAEEPENAENHLPLGNPGGYPLAARLADRIEQARAEQRAGTNPLG